jgi:2-polyprenyl-6-methoxyphenol hydroxylase-like FAD-dependent oxidoreductase
MRQETVSKSDYLGDRAVVVGGGIAGLSAARALSDRFRQVVVLDRDSLPDSATPRPSVPQGKHPHGLLAGGQEALEQMFPGFGNDLRQAGAVSIDRGFDVLYEIAKQDPWPRIKIEGPTYGLTRPLLELILRKQVARLTNVKVQDGCRVLNIIAEARTGAATDISFRTSEEKLETLHADFIIDASGNGSLTLEFLKATRRGLPEETIIGVKMHYCSVILDQADIKGNYTVAYTIPGAPEEKRGGLLLPAENGTYHLVLIGRGDDLPPVKEKEFRSFAASLRTPTIHNAIKNSRFLTEIVPASFSQSKWRHFAQVSDFPRGLLPIGDAICRFNPVYGQGMSSSARQANFLFELLGRATRESLETLAPDFLTKAEEIIADPWKMSALPDFAYPDTSGVRPENLEELLKFQKGLSRLAVRDANIHKMLVDVRNLLTPLSALNEPSIVSRVEDELASELSL